MLVAGVAIWLGVSLVAGVREAWDHQLYWQAGYPALAVAAGIGGFLVRSAWRPPLLLATSQFVAMLGINLAKGAAAGLLPLGLIVFVIMSLPLIIPAFLGTLAARHSGNVTQPGPGRSANPV